MAGHPHPWDGEAGTGRQRHRLVRRRHGRGHGCRQPRLAARGQGRTGDAARHPPGQPRRGQNGRHRRRPPDHPRSETGQGRRHSDRPRQRAGHLPTHRPAAPGERRYRGALREPDPAGTGRQPAWRTAGPGRARPGLELDLGAGQPQCGQRQQLRCRRRDQRQRRLPAALHGPAGTHRDPPDRPPALAGCHDHDRFRHRPCRGDGAQGLRDRERVRQRRPRTVRGGPERGTWRFRHRPAAERRRDHRAGLHHQRTRRPRALPDHPACHHRRPAAGTGGPHRLRGRRENRRWTLLRRRPDAADHRQGAEPCRPRLHRAVRSGPAEPQRERLDARSWHAACGRYRQAGLAGSGQCRGRAVGPAVGQFLGGGKSWHPGERGQFLRRPRGGRVAGRPQDHGQRRGAAGRAQRHPGAASDGQQRQRICGGAARPDPDGSRRRGGVVRQGYRHHPQEFAFKLINRPVNYFCIENHFSIASHLAICYEQHGGKFHVLS
ncbi:protein of unknown function [Rhodovastum atsumiense]|nr:protein of unknown function [Rhodovastum atsumiense]